MALAATSSAFTVPSHIIRTTTPLHNAASSEQDVELTRQVIMEHASSIPDNSIDDSTDDDDTPKKLIMDIPPPPSKAGPAYTKVTTKKPKSNPSTHKEGLLSPLVYAANTLLGKEELNKLRAKIITYHSDIIKSFVDTADSEFGRSVLKQLFLISDTDKSGYLDKEEVQQALALLGFKWLEEKHVQKIFERADLNDDGEISLEEFMEEAPKTLKVNLVKLAKMNGGEMGLLV